MAVADMQLAFPTIGFAIAIIAVLGSSFINLVIVIGISGWVTYARIARGQVLRVCARRNLSKRSRAQGEVNGALFGATSCRISCRH